MARAPEAIGKYKVISEIARGGMGAVYTAAHPTLDRTVIIKKLTMRGNAAVRERFRREASIMMDFRNEYIVDVFDHFREGPAYYIVQEFVDGMSLSELLQRERYLPERIALLVFRDCCRALKYAHDRGVIHRDIKPGNILLSRKGEVKLVDFGIAHIDDDNEAALTREGTMLGTPSYMAPEQFQDTRSVDKRADIYSLGVMLYEMMTGKRPFPGSVSAETLRLIQHGRYRKPRKHNPAITRFTARLIHKAMSARRSRRYQDLGAILKRLDRRFGSRGVGAQRPELAAFLEGSWQPPRLRSRTGRTIAIVAGALLIVAAGAVYSFLRGGIANEYLHPSSYGALTVTVRVARGSRPTGGTPVSAELFNDNGGTIPQVQGVHFAFRRSPTQDTQETSVFVSHRLYLPAGQYRIKLMAAGQLVWRGFYLESRDNQQRVPGRTSGRNLVIQVAKQKPLPLSVNVNVTSAATGEQIGGSTKVELYERGVWLPFTPKLAATLESGQTYRFRFIHPDYYPAEYALAISTFESNLTIDASLVPYPGALELSSSAGKLSLTLDGSHSYRKWSRTPQPEPLPTVGAKSTELSLSPGQHTLFVRSGSLTGTYSFKLPPLKRLRLKIVPDRKAGKIVFEPAGLLNAPGLAH